MHRAAHNRYNICLKIHTYQSTYTYSFAYWIHIHASKKHIYYLSVPIYGTLYSITVDSIPHRHIHVTNTIYKCVLPLITWDISIRWSSTTHAKWYVGKLSALMRIWSSMTVFFTVSLPWTMSSKWMSPSGICRYNHTGTRTHVHKPKYICIIRWTHTYIHKQDEKTELSRIKDRRSHHKDAHADTHR